METRRNAPDALLRLASISKSFPGVQALSDVSFELRSGEVVAVVGENGAGKSTLMQILAGVFPADQGSIYLDGRLWQRPTVRGAMKQGISLIHQELNLAENLSIAENMFLGRQPQRGPAWLPLTNRREMDALAEATLAQVGLNASPRALVSTLSIAQRQLVEIAKALSSHARILVFDEPTSSLSFTEAESLLELIERLQESGTAILYVTHHLREVVRLADRVEVLRDGHHVATLHDGEIQPRRMISLMVGRDVEHFFHREAHRIETGAPALETQKFEYPGSSAPVDFRIQPGEIVGFAGLVGAGRTELAHALFGINAPRAGRVLMNGRPTRIRDPAGAVAAGMGLVPEDRQRHGLLLSMAIGLNICLTVLGRLARRNWRNRSAERQTAANMIEELGIRATSSHQLAKQLSGGNQQKVVLAKWLATAPKVLLLDEPTRGVDVGAKSEIYRLIFALAAKGVAVMMISSEMEEIIGLSDRVIVMRDGAIVGELDQQEADEEAVLALAIGG